MSLPDFNILGQRNDAMSVMVESQPLWVSEELRPWPTCVMAGHCG